MACTRTQWPSVVVRAQEIKALDAERAKMPDLEVPAGSDLERMLNGGGGSIDPRAHTGTGRG
eukprot:946345-Prymnesium_polylepis.1